MFRIQITGGAPGRADLIQSYENRALAEGVAKAVVAYLGRNRLSDYRQGVQVIDDEGQWVWRQDVGSASERLN